MLRQSKHFYRHFEDRKMARRPGPCAARAGRHPIDHEEIAMHLLPPIEETIADLPGIAHQTLAGAAAGLRHLSVWRQTMAPGSATPPHRHDCEEVVIVEAGSGELHIGGAVHAFTAGARLVLEPNVDHMIVNSGSVPLTTTAVFSTSPVAVFLPDGSPLPLPWSS
jgi:quercetin dioxygenase-like cupin family protein